MNEQYTRAPHRRSTGPVGSSPNAALMIDFDNVTMAIRSNLGQELRTFLNSDIIRGKVSVQRAYADWRRYPQYIVPLSEASIDLIFAPAYGSSKKNATDIRLAIDATELVFTRPEIGTFILLSGDSDFSSLVLKLKEYGKYVIGVGLQESTSDLLVQNCDEYYSYNSLSGLTEASQLETISHDPWELAELAVKKMAERNDVMRSDRLKQVMLEIDSGFDEKEYGFSKFNRFLAEASSKGLLRLQRIENGQYEVGPADGGVSSGGRGGERSRRGRRGGRERESSGGRERESNDGRRGSSGRSSADSARQETRSAPPAEAQVQTSDLKHAYDLLREVVSRLAPDGGSVRDSEVKRALLERDEHFDEAALGFGKFSRFLRQASDEGRVDLETDDDGNYHVSVGAGGTASGGPSGEGSRGGRRDSDRRGGRGGGRGGRRGGREASGRTSEPEPERPQVRAQRPRSEAERPEPEEHTTASAAAASMARSREEASGGPVSGPEQQAAEEAAEPEEAPSRGESDRGRRGLGRFRRGSRGATGSAEGPELPGPVDAGGEENEGSPAQQTASRSETSAPVERDDRAHGERRVGIGARRGRRGSTASHAGSPEGGDGSAGASHTGSSSDAAPEVAGDEPATGAVDHMVKNYAGVGRKTAEALVDAFGAEVFAVIDEDPSRITRVLPEHRAQAVIEAREAEREDAD